MQLIAIALSCFLLAQQPAEPDPFQPKVVPGKRPAAAIDAGAAPAESPAPDPAPTTPADAPADPFPPAAAQEPSPAGPGLPETPDPPAAQAAASEPAQAPPDDSSKLAPVGDVPRQKLRPPELLADALATPEEGELEGKPLPLAAALSRTLDRQQQLAITQAYWRLSIAQAAHHWARTASEMLTRYTQPQATSAAVEGARAAAEANVRDAQLEVAKAQQELASLLGMPGDEPPLAVDRPHVGSYNTLYDRFFAGRAAPPRIRLINRVLPLRREAIDAHGAAIVATLDAVEATGQQIETSPHGLSTLLALLDVLQAEQQAFLAAVRQYNLEIAEYLFTVAQPGTTSDALVSRLILSGTPSRPKSATPAPAAAPPVEPGAPKTFDEATPTDPSAAPGENTTTNYQPADAAGFLDDGGLYSGLADLQGPARVQKLSESLHWYRGLPPDGGQSTPLAECLRSVPHQERLALLTAYWTAREQAARHQAVADRVAQLDALAAVAIALREQPGIAEAGVRLQSARRAAVAELAEAQIALVEAQFHLTQVAAGRIDLAWLLPATPPQSGRYIVAAATSIPAASRPWAKMIGVRHDELEHRADAIIRADEVRAALGNQARGQIDKGSVGTPAADDLSALDGLVWAVGRQSRETLLFLRTLTEYNLAIARYALGTSAPGISGDQLVPKLVIARTARGES